MIRTYNAARKSRKVWKKILSYGLALTVMNAFIIKDHFLPLINLARRNAIYCHSLWI